MYAGGLLAVGCLDLVRYGSIRIDCVLVDAVIEESPLKVLQPAHPIFAFTENKPVRITFILLKTPFIAAQRL